MCKAEISWFSPANTRCLKENSSVVLTFVLPIDLRSVFRLEGLFQPMHLLVIFGIALLIFGPKKLPDLGKGIGEGIRGFRSAMKEEEQKTALATSVADVQASDKE
jgi:sec-independent protein translocase protein TatA